LVLVRNLGFGVWNFPLLAGVVLLEVSLAVRLNVSRPVSRPASARASSPESRPQPQPLPLPLPLPFLLPVPEVVPEAVRLVLRLVNRLQVTAVEGFGVPRRSSADPTPGAVPGPPTPRGNCVSGHARILHIDGSRLRSGNWKPALSRPESDRRVSHICSLVTRAAPNSLFLNL
jgi:hypothetical protein